MKQPVALFRWRPFLVMLFLSLVSLAIWGQEDGNESNASAAGANPTPVRAAGNDWYTSPWVWVIGAVVIVLLLLAIFSSRGDTERTKISKIKRAGSPSAI